MNTECNRRMTSIIQVGYGYMNLYLSDETNGVSRVAGVQRGKERKDESESEDIRCISANGALC